MPWSSFTLNDGRSIPSIAFGSAGHSEDDTPGVIDTAIEVGFDHIDTAQMYKNEDGVGKGISQSDLPRSSLYITTKWSGLAPIPQSIDDSLEKLGVEYVDLYLVHNPRITNGDIEGTWKQMEEVLRSGKAKSIGVSNYSIEDLKKVLAMCRVKPVVNQILLHPSVYASSIPLLEYMKEHHILAEGYSSLRPLRDGSSPDLVKVVEEIARDKKIQPEQVLLAWSKAKAVLPITTSSNKQRAQSYITAGDVELGHDQINEIDHAGAKDEQARVWTLRKREYLKSLALFAAGAWFSLRGWRMFMFW